jgi:hypothetical protein
MCFQWMDDIGADDCEGGDDAIQDMLSCLFATKVGGSNPHLGDNKGLVLSHTTLFTILEL